MPSHDDVAVDQSGPSIAVLVVHGVSDPEPGQSARQIANLLTNLRPLGTYTYTTFEEHAIRVPVERVEVHEPPQRATPKGFEERNPDALYRHESERQPAEQPPEPADIGFMADQLRHYELESDNVFETVRLQGLRNDRRVETHVYEAYWADLSRVGAGVVAFFGQVYQLLLHLPSLGRNAVDYARAANPEKKWKLLSFWYRWSTRWLTLGIAPCNLALATLILPLLVPSLLSVLGGEGSALSVAVALGVLGLGLVCAIVLVLYAFPPRSPRRPVALVLIVISLAALAYCLKPLQNPAPLLLLESWIVSILVIGALFGRYASVRPGVQWIGIAVLLASVAWFFVHFAAALDACPHIDGSPLPHSSPPAPPSLVWTVMQPVALLDATLAALWLLHGAWLFLTLAIAVCCWRTEKRPRTEARHTVWTALFGLSFSTALFANLTLAVWSALFKGLSALLPLDTGRVHGIPQKLADCLRIPLECQGAPTWIGEIIQTSASTLFVLLTCLVAAFVVVGLWALFPSIVAEARPPARDAANADRMQARGKWLTAGLDWIPIAGLFFPAAFVFAVLVVAARLVLKVQIPGPTSGEAVLTAGAVLIGMIGMRFWLPGASAALDVLLDVDNHLRQHPRKRTPRARITARYTSLLRFILDPERNGGHRYDALVIVAHSQGAAITTDVLRFLSCTSHPLKKTLAKQPLMVFTMGNPSRLYARAFPWLYEWLWNKDGDGQRRFGPNPGELGVTRWVNAYRTGDYVGRFLWRDELPSALQRREKGDQSEDPPTVHDIDDTRQEFCMGEGAHTHYWDRHGHDTVWMLDQLIVAASIPAGQRIAG